MRYILYSSLFFSLATMISCAEKRTGETRMEAVTPITIPAVAPSTGTPPATIPEVTSATNNTVVAKLNPAHGQPGHQCDIAVGAPLPGGSASPAAAKTTSVTPVVQNTPVPTTPIVTAPAVTPGINPAHGQPGHRCDVAVGARIPKTASPEVKTTTPVTPVATPVVQNTPLVQPQVATVTPGLNPAHGQPGHRCDIAVGKPLNSAPKK